MNMVEVTAGVRPHLTGTPKPKKSTQHNVTLVDIKPAFHPVLGSAKMTVPDSVKRFHEYLKTAGLQDPTNKRSYNTDSVLKTALAGTEFAAAFTNTSVLKILHSYVLIKPPKAPKVPKVKEVKPKVEKESKKTIAAPVA